MLGALFLLTQFLQFDLGLSALQAGVRILPLAGVLVVSAAGSPQLSRAVGIKVTVAAGLAAIGGGLWQISAASTPATTYADVLTVASSAGGTTGPELARAARAAFMSGNRLSLLVAALVAAGGAVLVLAGLPARTSNSETIATGAQIPSYT